MRSRVVQLREGGVLWRLIAQRVLLDTAFRQAMDMLSDVSAQSLSSAREFSRRVLRLQPAGGWVLVSAALVITIVLVYYRGLAGGFLFDDYANLPALGRYGPVVDFDGLLRYLTSGIADPSGRPVADVVFLLDANTWPA